MKLATVVRIIALSLLMVGLFYMRRIYHGLPETIAVHFDLNNRPNGWADKDRFYKLFILLWCGLNAAILGLSALLLRRTPDERINIPWKRYWLSTAETRADLSDRVAALTAGTVVVLNLIFLVCIHAIYQGNTPAEATQFSPQTDLALLGVAVVLFILWTFWLFKPPADAR
jgi:uncharacterized membrane protein